MLLYNSIWGVGSLSQGLQAKKSGIRQVGFAPPALPLYSGRDVFPIKAMMMFRHLLTHFETLWGILSNFGQIWAILNHFEQLFRAGLGHFEQFWAFLSGKFGSCRAIFEQFLETRYGIVDLGQCSNVSIEAALRHLTLAEEGGWCKPHGSRP